MQYAVCSMQYSVCSMQYAKTQAKITAQDKPDFGWCQKLIIIIMKFSIKGVYPPSLPPEWKKTWYKCFKSSKINYKVNLFF